MAKKLLAAGCTVADLAERFNVTIATVRRWQVKHDDFLAACMLGRGRRSRDVERALFKRAIGYDRYVEKSIKHEGELVRMQCKEHVPPDVQAAIFWLTNRMPQDWSLAPDPAAANSWMSKDDVLNEIAQQLSSQYQRLLPRVEAP